jgi:hypothetical protein
VSACLLFAFGNISRSVKSVEFQLCGVVSEFGYVSSVASCKSRMHNKPLAPIVPPPPLSVYLDLDVAVLTSFREEERLKERGQEGEGEGPKGGPSCGKETCPSVPLLWYGDGIQTRMCRGLCVHLSTYEGSPRLNISC